MNQLTIYPTQPSTLAASFVRLYGSAMSPSFDVGRWYPEVVSAFRVGVTLLQVGPRRQEETERSSGDGFGSDADSLQKPDSTIARGAGVK
jgi:hypothetical protein